jgi:hypothetical protein
MKRICSFCKGEYEDGGDSWKKTCYPCYQDYRGRNRIMSIRYKSEVYITAPNVTKEELDAWIRKNRSGDVGWGAEEWKPEQWTKFKVWIDSTNFD